MSDQGVNIAAPQCECAQACCDWCSVHGATANYQGRKSALLDSIADEQFEEARYERAIEGSRSRLVALRAEYEAILAAERSAGRGASQALQ